MRKLTMIIAAIFAIVVAANAQPTSLTLQSPSQGDQFRVGRTFALKWDTTGTFNYDFKFYWSDGPSGPWTALALPSGDSFKDVNSKNTTAAIGTVNSVAPNVNSSNVYFKMTLASNETVSSTVGPCTINVPTATQADSVLHDNIEASVTLSNRKVYSIDKVVFVRAGATLNIEAGTIIVGKPGAKSALCINRGAKIYAQGRADAPIIMTSGAQPGERDRGDWGGLVVLGRATTNKGENAAIEGGIAAATHEEENGWYGGTNDDDSSGVISYVRVEFAGFAVSPDNELNGVTFGGVGRKTVVNHLQISYSGDDAIECFGGSVNIKNLIAYGTLDDDFDTDNGYSGKVQYGLIKRFSDVADQSNSEGWESDNDGSSSENQPFTRAVYSNVTAIGGVQDVTWESGIGANKWNPKFLTAAQIRRNSRISIWNSVVTGWPRGVEMTNDNTVRAAKADSTGVRFNNFYSIKDAAKNFYFGSGTTPDAPVDANWLNNPSYGNEFKNDAGNAGTNAFLTNVFPPAGQENLFNPLPTVSAPYLNNANFDAAGVIPIDDSFFDKVKYRGAFGTERWDLPWAEYDPVNADYNPAKCDLLTPAAGSSFRTGRTITLSWDTKGTYNHTYKFQYSIGNSGPWTDLVLKSGATFTDAANGKPVGNVLSVVPDGVNSSNVFIKMVQTDDANFMDINGPMTFKIPEAVESDSTLSTNIESDVTLDPTQVYDIDKVIFVKSGATLRIPAGTIILGKPGAKSALCINRGAKIYAQGTKEHPIIMTSGAQPGERDRGDWGGLVVLGRATTNKGLDAAIEGGIASATPAGEDGWYGGTDDDDSSGVISYVRVEFAGFAVSPDNELNGVTFGGVGRKTVVNHLQISYSGDDAIECFGGSVNVKYLIAYGTLDDDFDTDNGYSGKVQFGLIKRFSDVADQSNSEGWESDNDGSASENQPFTRAIYSNVTAIGGVQDVTWSSGIGANTWNPKFLTAAQIRRNSRISIWNSVVTGWPRGVEMTNNNTVRAAKADSLGVRYCSFYSIKDATKNFYFGSGTTADAPVDANWLNTASYNNTFKNDEGDAGDQAFLTKAFVPMSQANLFDPTPKSNAPYLTTANFDAAGVIAINDPFFDKVAYRGAFAPGVTRWDDQWSEYDPVNAEYIPLSVNDEQANKQIPNIKVMPQPAQEVASVTYTMSVPTTATVKLINATGAVEATIINNEYQQGVQQLNINTSSLSSGMYFLEIITNQGTKVVPVVVAH